MRLNHQQTNTVFGILLFISIAGLVRSQTRQTTNSKDFEQGQIPITTRWLLSSAKAEQRNRVHAVTNGVFLFRCSDRKGTGFLLKSGTVVTNEHVVEGCNVGAIWAESPMGKKITFSKMLVDKNRDLAILLPNERLQGGFGLSSGFDPPLETKVSTWGFPLTHSGPAPLLSVGYVAGYDSGDVSKPVKHIVVNGAFNPGNSGGPVFAEGTDEVVGVVVTKWTLFSPNAQVVIKGLQTTPTKTGSNLSVTNPNGSKRSISNEEAVAAVLAEFYNQVQVMIGEAISVSELRDFLQAKESELRK